MDAVAMFVGQYNSVVGTHERHELTLEVGHGILGSLGGGGTEDSMLVGGGGEQYGAEARAEGEVASKAGWGARRGEEECQYRPGYYLDICT
jgi:hypothetical protein